ncbi:MAG TPA: aminotransferase class IV [Polyangiaceae bacterium]|nr:aminotransferase class IV [Polyangiaceae bacterium]
MARAPVWSNGTLVGWDEARVSVLSHGIQRGALVFDVGPMRDAGSRTLLFRPREHVARLLRSAALVGHRIPWSEAQLLEATVATARAAVAAGTSQALVRWSAYVATVEPDVVPRAAAAASVAIAVITPEDQVLPGADTPAPKAETVRLQVPRDLRKAGPEVFPPQAKVAASYLGPMLAKRAALAAGFDEVVLLDREGRVAEAPTCNVFAVRGGELVTPPLERVLAGITRDAVLAVARAEGIPAREAHMTPEELAEADEAFLTASSLPVQGVASVDGRAMKDGAPGPVTRRLRAALTACERGEDARFASWVVDVRG